MELISKFNEGIRFLLCVIDIFSKYAWVIPLKDKKGVTVANAFQSILNDSKRKSKKIWVDKGSEFYNRSMKSWLEKNDIEMYSTHNEGKSAVAKRFIRTLKDKIYKHMTAVSKKYLYWSIKWYSKWIQQYISQSIVDKDNTYIDFNKEVHDKDPKFKVGDHVRISKYKNIFAKVYTPNWSEKVLWLKKSNTLFHGHMSLVKKLLENFKKKNCKRQIKKNLG